MDDCPLCLEPIETDHVKKTLSCGHRLHFRCFIQIVYRQVNMFISCPICRMVNEDTSKPYTDPEKNLRILCSRKVGKVRCICKTKKGTVCKRKGVLFNYGMCTQHHPNVLKKEYYPLMEKYIYFILCQRYNFLSRLYSIDIGKKLIIKYANKDTSIEDILVYWLKYITMQDEKYIKDYSKVYEYYDLEKPDKSWINYCSKNYNLL